MSRNLQFAFCGCNLLLTISEGENMNQIPPTPDTPETKKVMVGSQKQNDMFEVLTRGSKYMMVVTNPEMRNVALMTNSNSVPGGLALCRLMGTISGGTFAVGCIAVGSYMSIRDNADISGNCIITRTVTDIRQVAASPLRAAHIIAKAERSFTEAVEKVIAKEFVEDNHESVRKIIGYFGNPAGKSAALGALVRANSHDKLLEAMELLEKYWARFWEIEYPEVAGDPGNFANESRWHGFCDEVGITAV